MTLYWKVLFWINIVLAVIHACLGSTGLFIALATAALCWFMLENSTEE